MAATWGKKTYPARLTPAKSSAELIARNVRTTRMPGEMGSAEHGATMESQEAIQQRASLAKMHADYERQSAERALAALQACNAEVRAAVIAVALGKLERHQLDRLIDKYERDLFKAMGPQEQPTTRRGRKKGGMPSAIFMSTGFAGHKTEG